MDKQLKNRLNQIAITNFTTIDSILKNGLCIFYMYHFKQSIRQQLIDNSKLYDEYYKEAVATQPTEDDLITALIDGYEQIYLDLPPTKIKGQYYYEYSKNTVGQLSYHKEYVPLPTETISYQLEKAHTENIKQSQLKLDQYYKSATKELKTASKNVSAIKSRISAKKLELSALLSKRNTLSNDSTGSYEDRVSRQQQLRNIDSQIPQLTADINSLETKLTEAEELLREIQSDLFIMDKYKADPNSTFPYVDYKHYE